MGYLKRNNEMISDAFLSWQILQPFKDIMEFNVRFYCKQIRIYNPGDIFNNEFEIGSGLRLRNDYHFYTNIGFGTRKHDYYETRVKDRFLYEPYQYWIMFNAESDRRKPFVISADLLRFGQPESGQNSIRENIDFSLRIGQHLNLIYNTGLNRQLNDLGFVDKTENEDTIYFARRNIKTLENGLKALCAINSKAGISLRIRHYWSGAVNKSYFQLQNDGGLLDDHLFTGNNDQNYNAFNVGLMYRWVFAPGSELSVLWTNSEFENTNIVNYNYWENFNKTLKTNRINSFSIKVLYYIDYNYLKRKKFSH
jgi:hypothetical protein